MEKKAKKLKVVAAMSPHKSLRDSAGQAGGVEKKRVVVAISGGVDSSVAAALLNKQGYDVVGVFMRFWSEPQNNKNNSPHPSLNIREGENPPYPSFKKEGEERRNTCCSEGAEAAARAVATKLNIPFYVLRFEKEFKKAVVDYFLAEEKRGRTPNPCVVCNKKIKFGLLFQKALGMGADFVATGHYARKVVIASERSERGNPVESSNGGNSAGLLRRPALCGAPRNETILRLLRAKDEEKDQSYFLYTLGQKQLSQILFPIGDYTKNEVYQMAKKWQLPYRQGESFDLCFVVRDRESFIKRYLKLKPGKIYCYNSPRPSLNIREGVPPLKLRGGEGELLGYHQGLALYTIGQRKNLPLRQGPWWVVKKDEKKNILYVSNNEKDLYSCELIVADVNWLIGKVPKFPAKILAKIRYKSEAAEGILSPVIARRRDPSLCSGQAPQSRVQLWSGGIATPSRAQRGWARNDILKLVFKKPQRAITLGQSVVFYRRDGEVLGGGIINK